VQSDDPLARSTKAAGDGLLFGLASSLQKFPSRYGQHVFGIGFPRLGRSFKAL
jgi:hypothetical protein